MMPQPDDIAAEACYDAEKVEAQAMHRNQSVWMAHWMHTSYKSATPACNRLRIDCEVKEGKENSGAEQRDLLGGLDRSMHAGAVGEPARATSVSFTNDADNDKTSCDSKTFPTLKFSRKLDERLPLQRAGEVGKSETESCSGDDNVSLNRAGTSGAGLPLTSTYTPLKIETLVKECQVLSREVLPTAMLLKSPPDVEQKNLAFSTSLWNEFVKSASDIVLNGRGKGKTVVPQFTHVPFEICKSSYNLASKGRFTSTTSTKYHTFSSLLISEKKISSLLDPQKSSFSRWMQGGGVAPFPRDSIPGSDDRLYFIRDQKTQHREIEKYVANPNIPDHTGSSESNKPQNVYGLSSEVAQMPFSIHDVGSMKIYTSIDSVDESSRDCPEFSQTTHHFLSKKTDVNFSDRGQFFREPMAPAITLKGNAFNEILDYSPPTSGHKLEGLKLEPLGSSIKREGKENVQDFKCLKNESSAETDIMDISALHKNNLPGDVRLQTNKCSKYSQNSLTSQVVTISAREKAIAKSVNAAIPDINLEPHELLTEERPVVDRETSTSRTHSLDLDRFLSSARSNSGSSSLGLDPSSRWVKRLKLCALGSAHGTESTKIRETSSHEKVKNIFGKITKDGKTSLESKTVHHAEGQMVLDLPAKVSTKGKSSFTEAKKTVEITLSHPWIQRWSHNYAASSQKGHELGELREPKSSNAVLEQFQKKQFPSIAAMALMGKAMDSLNPSELMKKGPVIVWNMKGF